MSRPRHPLRSLVPAAVLAATVCALLLGGSPPAFPDDTDLLRFDTAKPYVFIILDTSASMALAPNNSWLHAGGDDPRSKIYSAKKVLHEVMSEVDDVHFGFAALNQDDFKPTSKHWLYYAEDAAPQAWLDDQLGYPAPDPDGPIRVDPTTGQDFDDVEGDVLTFGPHYPIGTPGVAGSCPAPLPWSSTLGNTNREKINRFAKLNLGGTETRLWVTASNRVYLLTVNRPGNKPDGSPNAALGEDDLHVTFDLRRVEKIGPLHTCSGSNDAVFDRNYPTHNVKLRLWTSFLIADGVTPAEPVPAFWPSNDFSLTSSCNDPHPFSGIGWEGNYDTAAVTPNDQVCKIPGLPASCFNLMRGTTADPTFGTWRVMDRGDLLPLDWRVTNKSALLERLAPGTNAAGAPDFAIASYFTDPPVSAATDTLQLASDPITGRVLRPLVAGGLTPLGKSVVDFRCFYRGEGNKCKDSAYDTNGWEEVALGNDSSWGCRRPYLIVISDGDDTCPGENPCADTADLNSKSDVRTWVIAYGQNCSSVGNPLKCMAQNGKGDLVCPQDPQSLKDELKRILGEIREEARSFASAAVPSVQAIADQTIFLTDFTPINARSIWDGHVKSFLKPLPVDDLTRRPDLTQQCLAKNLLSECFLWDSGVEIKKQASGVGSGDNQRRVFYSQPTTSGFWPTTRQLFVKTDATTDIGVKRDLWRGLGIPFLLGDTDSEADAEIRANAVIDFTYAVKNDVVTVVDPSTGAQTTKPISFILGDVFHSNPLVVGGPSNTRYFAGNLPGYRDFTIRHQKRRKLLFVGGNDGMLHAFDAGIFRETASDHFSPKSLTDEYDNGTGREVFAYIPRAAMPKLTAIAETDKRPWAVDGSVSVADVFIDPEHDGTPVVAEREWRTVLIGGLREGEKGYYALDITQPDQIGAENVPDPDGVYVPSCAAAGGALPGNCGPVPFPAAVWEFDDSVVDASGQRIALDEDMADFDRDGVLDPVPDLGFTWSVPNIGRIRVRQGGATVDKYVAVFGGGFPDPDFKTAPRSGQWLYMVDIETGEALYKRRFEGPVPGVTAEDAAESAPSEPAAVDTDQDGYLDRIYIGTLAGTLYRVDLGREDAGQFPALTTQSALGVDKLLHDVERVPTTFWAPKAIFKTSSAALAPLPAIAGRPIYFRPSVIFVAELGRYAISFGTGNREDLWQKENQDGRFYIFVDDTDQVPPAELPLTETRLQRLTVAQAPTGGRFLLDEGRGVGNKGWYLVLAVEERVITDPFALSGVSFFSTFNPITCEGTIDPITGECHENTRNDLCSRGGTSRVFVVNTTNGDAFMKNASNLPTRFFEVSTFVTNPYTEQGQSKNPLAEAPGSNADELTENLKAVMEELKKLFPANCKFANYRVDIKTISADTGVVFIAPVPICIVEKNWREH